MIVQRYDFRHREKNRGRRFFSGRGIARKLAACLPCDKSQARITRKNTDEFQEIRENPCNPLDLHC